MIDIGILLNIIGGVGIVISVALIYFAKKILKQPTGQQKNLEQSGRTQKKKSSKNVVNHF